MEKPVIGMDFGNYNSFTCFISDIDEGTRLGGIVHDLLPQNCNNGIPSVYYYSRNIGVLCGDEAMRDRAKPVENRIRYLKRHLGADLVLDGENIGYDRAITELIQYCIRRANKELKNGYQVTTNEISLSYPVMFTSAQRNRLIELAERATLEDGTAVKVRGTISEPAAAALDYLASYTTASGESTVLAYDLGGGTFDLALVTAFPGGKKNAEGNTYYYDVRNHRGLDNVGGVDFDSAMYGLLCEKFSYLDLKPVHYNALMRMAEKLKCDLSSDDSVNPELTYGDQYETVTITREELEEKTIDLVRQTVEETKAILQATPDYKPDFILLTGGASQMPLIRQELERAIPEYKDRILDHRPSRAIAYGAARFGTIESETDPVVQQRILYNIGVRVYRDYEAGTKIIDELFQAGSPIPAETEWRSYYTPAKNLKAVNYSIFEAIKGNPAPDQYETDYKEIMSVDLEFDEEVPEGTRSECRLVIDRLNRLTVEARNPEKPGKPAVRNSVVLKNLSN